jgi:hypothetical protein
MKMSGGPGGGVRPKPLMDKYGRRLTMTEAAKRADYRKKLKSAGSEKQASAMREAEMKRRAQFRKTTSLQGAKGPGKGQAQMEAGRMASSKKAGASASESRRMSSASQSKTNMQRKRQVQQARMSNRARRAGM